MKKALFLFTLMFILLLCFTACGTAIAPTPPKVSQGLEYVLSEDCTYYSVIGIGSCEDKRITIPSSYNGLPVKHIGYMSFAENEDITKITIPKSISTIEEGAFLGCENLNSIIFEKNSQLESIGNRAFFGSDIKNITIPCSVRYIGVGALLCENLTNIYVEENHPFYQSIDGNLFSKDGKTFVLYAAGKQQKNVTIPENVTHIGDGAFAGNILETVHIPDSVISIGNYAFMGCGNLSYLSIPCNVTYIGDYAFANCHNPPYLVFPEQITHIGDYAFAAWENLTSVTIPQSVITIGKASFCFCNNLTNINVDASNPFYQSIDGNLYTKDGKTLVQYASGKQEQTFIVPNDVTEIYSSAFNACNNLTDIILPEGVVSIGDNAFEACYNLKKITIPNSINKIGLSAFSACFLLTDVYYAGSKTEWNAIEIDSYNLYLTKATVHYHHYLPHEHIDPNNDGACDLCSFYLYPFSEGLKYTLSDDETYYIVSGIGTCQDTDVKIPPVHNYLPVKMIGRNAFGSNWNIVSVTIPDSIVQIENNAFYDCEYLVNVYFGSQSQLQSIGMWAFECCWMLENITIPSKVVQIGSGAFLDCYNLSSVIFSENSQIQVLEDYVFNGCGITSMIIPASVKNILYDAFLSCSKLKTITFAENSQLESIGESAFAGCYNLENIVIPQGVTMIGSSAFDYCINLNSIFLPASVMSIGDYAFCECKKLINISVDEENLTYQTIDGNLYSKDGKTLIQYAPGKQATSFIVPQHVTKIAETAFAFCHSLTCIVIPESVTSIEHSAFYGCDKLTDVYYTGNNTQWSQIYIDSNNSELTSANIHFDSTYEVNC